MALREDTRSAGLRQVWAGDVWLGRDTPRTRDDRAGSGSRYGAGVVIFTYRELLIAAQAIPAGDTHGANAWLLRVAATLKDRELALQPHQRAYLYRMRGIWKRRAAGQDARWMEWGSAPGAKRRKRATPAPPVRLPSRAVDNPARTVVNPAPAVVNSASRVNDLPPPPERAGTGLAATLPRLSAILSKYR